MHLKVYISNITALVIFTSVNYRHTLTKLVLTYGKWNIRRTTLISKVKVWKDNLRTKISYLVVRSTLLNEYAYSAWLMANNLNNYASLPVLLSLLILVPVLSFKDRVCLRKSECFTICLGYEEVILRNRLILSQRIQNPIFLIYIWTPTPKLIDSSYDIS